MGTKTRITVAYGDGIGPEIMEAALLILQEAGAQLEIEEIGLGAKIVAQGHASGIEPSAWESLRRTKVLLKGPATTPQGGGFRSTATTFRKTLGLYAKVSHAISYHPYVETKFPRANLIIVREGEEDASAGMEHRQSVDEVHGAKFFSRPGCERVIRHAFEHAQAHGRKKVTCFTKDNILKMTDGLFRQTFDEIGVQYPEVEKEHLLVDIGAAKLADQPEEFDVLVVPNAYGDILSEVAAQMTGSVGLVGSASLGTECAMFEALHGSAPRLAGQNLANPSALFLGGVMLLAHIGQTEAAARAHNAWLKTIEDGVHTGDIFVEGISRQKVGTKEFAKAVVERLGQAPTKLAAVSYKPGSATPPACAYRRPLVAKQLVGVDVVVEFLQGSAEDLARILQPAEIDGLKLETIGNRGMKVWPHGHAETFCIDAYTCRFQLADDAKGTLAHASVVALLDRVLKNGVEFLKTELLYTFDGKPGFSAMQGE